MSALEQDDTVVDAAAATPAAYPITGAVRVWNGGTADWYSDNWTTSTSGVADSYPLPGDSATVASGLALLEGSEAKVGGTFNDNAVTLGSGTSATATLELDAATTGQQFGVTVGGDAAITATGISDFEGPLTFDVAGATLTLGAMAGGNLVFSHDNLTFSGTDTVEFTGVTTLEAGAGVDAPSTVSVVNDGVVNEIGVTTTFERALSGTGEVNLEFGAVMVAEGAVAAGQTIVFGNSANVLMLSSPSTFQGTIQGYAPGQLLDFPTLTADGASYDATTHELTLTEAGTTVLTLDNVYAQAGALVTQVDDNGGTLVGYAGTPDRESYLIDAGDQALGANTVRSTLDVPGTTTAITGSGVKIGIISDSFNTGGTADANAQAGYLPENANGDSAVVVLKEGAAGSSDEGQEMAEVVHQVAPGAQLYFASAGGSPEAAGEAVQALQAAGCTIIVDDSVDPAAPQHQVAGIFDGSVVSALGDNVNFFNSGGNYGQSFYQGAFTAAQTMLSTGATVSANVFDNGTPYEPVTVQAGVDARIDLQWTAPYLGATGTGAPAALSFELIDPSTNKVVATSSQAKDGTTPTTDIYATITPTATTTYELVVISNTATPPAGFSFIMTSVGTGVGEGGTIDDPGAASGSGDERGQQLIPGVNSVGAVYYGQSAAYGQTPSANEGFSAYGPGELLYATNGQALATPQSDGKPDFSAPDGVTTMLSSASSFYGTSSAAPEAAAVAALMLQADPYLETAQISYLLAQSAIPFGDPLRSGAGLIQAGPAVQGAIAAATTPIWTAQDHSTDWDDAANWSDQAAPTTDGAVQIGDALTALSGPYAVTYGDAQGTIASLDIDGSGAAQPSLLIEAGASLTVSGAVTLEGAAGLEIAGVLSAASLTIDATSHLMFASSADVTLAMPVSGAGELQQSGTGLLTLTGVNTYSGGTVIEAGSLDLDQTTSGTFGAITSGAAGTGAITFASAGETLWVENTALTTTNGVAELLYAVQGFVQGDVIDLGGVSGVTGATYDGSTLDLTGGGATLAALHIGAGYGADGFDVAADGSGGTDVTLSEPITISGLSAGQAVADDATLQPLASVSVQDGETNAGAETAVLTVVDPTDGVVSDALGTLSGAGLTQTAAGTYSLSADNAADLTQALRALVFTPTAHLAAPGLSTVASIDLAVTDSQAGGSGTSATSIVSTAATLPIVTTDQALAVTERVLASGDVLSGDSSSDLGGSLTVLSAALSGMAETSVPAAGLILNGDYGTLTIGQDGSYAYAAEEGLTVGVSYVDTFDLTVSDGQGQTATQTLTLDVTGSALGNADNNIIVGGSGAAETLTGLGGPDLLIAGAAPDTFRYTAATDSPYSATVVTYDAIEGFRTGTDHINVSAADGGAVELVRDDAGGSPQTFVYFDPADGGGYQAVIDVYGVVQAGDLVVSTAVAAIYDYGDSTANQVLDGSAGHAFLVAGSGSGDSLLAGPSDTLYAGAGADTFVIGSLAASPSAAYDVIADFKSGTDHLDVSAADGGHVLIQMFEGDAFVYFDPDSSGGFQGVVEVTGPLAAADLVLSASAATNGVQIVGDANEAATAQETLTGGPNTDYIYAGSGADTLYGAGGGDFLVGGAGADTFAYHAVSDSTPGAQDIIDNFDPAKGDIIDLSVLDQNSGVTGQFVTAFDGHAGEYELVTPTAASSYWHVLGDLTGAGSADFEIAFNVTGATTDYQSIQAHIHL